MIIDINPILKGEKKQIDVDYLLSIDDRIEEIDFAEAFPVKGSAKDMAGYITLKLEADVKYQTSCARCLAPISESMSIIFEKTIVTEDTGLQNEENDDYVLSKDGYLDIDETLSEQIILELLYCIHH